MKTFITTEHTVQHMEMDLDSDFLFFSEKHALKKTNGTSTLPVVGVGSQRGYQEGVGPEARFYVLMGFTQINSTSILTADWGNHCLRLVDKISFTTSTLAGHCRSSGTTDGGPDEARFYWPYSIVRDPTTESDVVVTDEGSSIVRQVNLRTGFTKTLVSRSSRLRFPLGMVADFSGRELLITTRTGISGYNARLQRLRIIAGKKDRLGYSDKSLRRSFFRWPRAVVQLSDDIILVADTDNNRLRVLNMANDTVSSICTGREKTKNTIATNCGLERPDSLLVEGEKIYIGQRGAIRTLRCE